MYDEPIFDLTLAIATAAAFASYMLGVLIDPVLALAGGTVLLAAAVVAFVPAGGRLPAAVAGFLALALAGVIVPLYVTRAARPGARLPLSLALSGIVLALAFAVLRVTAFGRRVRRTA